MKETSSKNKRRQLSHLRYIHCVKCYEMLKINLSERRGDIPIICPECKGSFSITQAENFEASLSDIDEGICPNCSLEIEFDFEDKLPERKIECPGCKDHFYIDEAVKSDFITYSGVALDPKYVENIKREGARDKDFEIWWSLTQEQQKEIFDQDNLSRITLFIDLLEQGVSEKDVTERIRKTFPMYGDPNDTSQTSGDDRPLPYELKDRINTHTERQIPNGLQRFKEEKDRFSSYNAYIRHLIKKGRI